MIVARIYQKEEDDEDPNVDIAATLTRHMDGKAPEYIPVDQQTSGDTGEGERHKNGRIDRLRIIVDASARSHSRYRKGESKRRR